MTTCTIRIRNGLSVAKKSLRSRNQKRSSESAHNLRLGQSSRTCSKRPRFPQTMSVRRTSLISTWPRVLWSLRTQSRVALCSNKSLVWPSSWTSSTKAWWIARKPKLQNTILAGSKKTKSLYSKLSSPGLRTLRMLILETNLRSVEPPTLETLRNRDQVMAAWR